jgi:hypothetical protein
VVPEYVEKLRALKRVDLVFGDDLLALQGTHVGMELTAGLGVVPHVDHQGTGGPEPFQESSGVRAGRFRVDELRLASRKIEFLDIDEEQGGLLVRCLASGRWWKTV